MTPSELLQQYPNLDINTDGGSDSFVADMPIVERHTATMIVRHPTEDSYLMAVWKQSVWTGWITGGIESGDTVSETAAREVYEETGYKNIGEIKPMEFTAHGLFYHPVKKVNRLAHYHLVFVQLADLERDETGADEQAIADFVWVPADQVRDRITRNDMKSLWDYYWQNK